jgi:hypothetical protein
MDVEVDPEQDQRPEDRREQSGTDLLEGVETRPVMVGGRDDRQATKYTSRMTLTPGRDLVVVGA